MPGDGFSLQGRRALVTGAGRGLGLEIARALAGAGAEVLVNGRTPETVAAAAAVIAAAGGRARASVFDIAEAPARERALAELDRLDVLVNNVGVRDRRALGEFDAAAAQALLRTNLIAPFELCRLAAPRMPPGGRILNVTSIAGPLARSGDALYTMAKGGLEALTRALAAELGPAGINVNAIAPGYFATEANADMANDPAVAAWLAQRTSLGRWGRPGEIAGAALFLCAPASAYVTGQVLAVDGGYLAHF